ncbi:5-formyltetrahydrofolate cyclo-ligase [Syntrophomonas curvata]
MADRANREINGGKMPIESIQARRDSLRKKMAARRKDMSSLEVDELSAQIFKRLEQLQPLAGAQVIMGYSSIKNEVNLIPWLVQLKEQGRTILLPRVEGNCLEAIELKDWDDMGRGSFGIREPRGEAFAVEKIDVVLVPGLVFDANGYRLGYGKGYYDRFLPRLSKQCFNCGVCYEYQVADNVFPNPADVPVHWIVTDRSEIAVDMSFF